MTQNNGVPMTAAERAEEWLKGTYQVTIDSMEEEISKADEIIEALLAEHREMKMALEKER